MGLTDNTPAALTSGRTDKQRIDALVAALSGSVLQLETVPMSLWLRRDGVKFVVQVEPDDLFALFRALMEGVTSDAMHAAPTNQREAALPATGSAA